MKKVFLKSVLIRAVVLLGGCGSSAGTGSSSSDNDSDYMTDTSGSDYTTDYGYTAEFRNASITECTDLGADINLCVCVYEYLSANLAFSELTKIDDEIRNGASATNYPVMIQANEYCV